MASKRVMISQLSCVLIELSSGKRRDGRHGERGVDGGGGLKSQIENVGRGERIWRRGWRGERGLKSQIQNAGKTCWPTTLSLLRSHSISLPLLRTLAP